MAVLIYPPTIDWNWMKLRPQLLLEQFAKDGHEVYYCNKTQEPLRASKYTQVSNHLTVVHDNRHFLRHVVPQLVRSKKKIILWVTCAKQYIFAEQYFPSAVVFDFVDDFPVWAPYLEDMLIQSDIVFTASRPLQEKIRSISPVHRCELVRNGVNPEQYRLDPASPPVMPSDFPQGGGPVIGYAGAMASWVDKDLVRRIAQQIPEARIVIVGAELGAKAAFTAKNVHYLGMKPEEELPTYLHHFDACIIPFKKNGVTLATNPLMMYQYLAAGKPVVTVDLPETRDIPEVYAASTHDEFVARLRSVLSTEFVFNRSAAKRWLSQNTWRSRYVQARSALAEILPHILSDQDGAEANGTELDRLMERVIHKMEKASKQQPALIASYLRGLDQTLSSLTR
jgi:teichuronic acid biosynthesis glycosyltransferase TuaH